MSIYKDVYENVATVRQTLNDIIDCFDSNVKWGSDEVWQRDVHYINALSYALETITGERFKKVHIVGDRKIEWR